MNQPYGYIYLIIDHLENKVYVGMSTKFDKIHTYYGSGNIISNIIYQRGIIHLEKRILGYCNSESELRKAEEECIFFYRAFGADGKNLDNIYGYNLTPVSNGGVKNKGALGRKHTPSEIEKMIKIQRLPHVKQNKIKKMKEVWANRSQEEIQKLSLKWSGEKNGFYNKKHTEKALQIMSRKSKQYFSTHKHYRLIEFSDEQICGIAKLYNNNISYRDIGRMFNVSRNKISRIINTLINEDQIIERNDIRKKYSWHKNLL